MLADTLGAAAVAGLLLAVTSVPVLVARRVLPLPEWLLVWHLPWSPKFWDVYSRAVRDKYSRIAWTYIVGATVLVALFGAAALGGWADGAEARLPEWVVLVGVGVYAVVLVGVVVALSVWSFRRGLREATE